MAREACERKRKEAMDKFVPRPAASPYEEALNAIGEKQLSVDGLFALDLMVATSVYGLNRDLRKGTTSEADVYADGNGIGYTSEILELADDLFGKIDLRIDPPRVVYRGGRMSQPTPPQTGEVYTDNGYLFCSPDETTARRYTECGDWDYGRDAVPVLWRMTVNRALYIPDPAERSRALTSRAFCFPLLSTADRQFVVNRGSSWCIDKVSRTTSGVVEIEATQL